MARNMDSLVGFGAFSALSVAVASCWLCAVPGVAKQGSTGSSAVTYAAAPPAQTDEASRPDATVRQFYDWYLGELRRGGQPFRNAAAMRAYFTGDAISGFRDHALAGFDPVLLLPEPSSAWAGMRVSLGPPRFYRRPGYSDAYVEVIYHGFGKHRSDDPWTLGLKRTPQGWRIATITVNE